MRMARHGWIVGQLDRRAMRFYRELVEDGRQRGEAARLAFEDYRIRRARAERNAALAEHHQWIGFGCRIVRPGPCP
jgi:hypothetical protein